jgi:hypothetical protein
MLGGLPAVPAPETSLDRITGRKLRRWIQKTPAQLRMLQMRPLSSQMSVDAAGLFMYHLDVNQHNSCVTALALFS